MEIFSFIKALRDQGIALKLVDGQLEVSFLKDHIENYTLELLKKHKSEIMEYLASVSVQNDFQAIPSLQKASCYAVSNAQLRIWIESQSKDASLAYNMPFKMMLEGNYNIPSLKKAIYYVVGRHEILRTVFRLDQKDELRQNILPLSKLNLNIVLKDFRNKDNALKEISNYIKVDNNIVFNLQNGPLLRMAILRYEANRFVFYCNMHHIICDAWSVAILKREIEACYKAIVTNKEPPLPSLRIQYKDYAFWHLQQLESDKLNRQKKYWVEKFSQGIPVLDLPLRQQRPLIKTYSGETLKTYFSEGSSVLLKKYAYKNNGSIFMVVLGTLQILLSRYTGNKDIVIGSPFAGREHAELQNQIGFYANTVALRNRLDRTDSFEDFFCKVKQTVMEAYTNQQYPFEELVKELGIGKNPSRNPLFDVMLVVLSENEKQVKNDLEKFDHQNIIREEGNTTSKFDLLFFVEEIESNLLSLKVEYNTDLFENSFIEQLIRHYKRMVDLLLAKPQEAVTAINYVTGGEGILKSAITKEDYPKQVVIELFENQVNKTPQATAICFEDISQTYQQLNHYANQLAHYLLEKHFVTPHTNVGVVLSRSHWSIVAMLGVIKSGACYVPIDSNFHFERKNYIIEDAEIEIIISETGLLEEGLKTKIIAVFLDKFIFSDWNNINIPIINGLDDAAFIIYTSGSTGKPKGVVQTHRMLSNLIQWNIYDSGIDLGLRHLQYASFSFDVSLQDCWFVLSSGGTLYITPEPLKVDFKGLLKFTIDNFVEVLSLPFAALSGLFEFWGKSRNKNFQIRHIISSGEQLAVNGNLENFLIENPSVKLHNHYGPSETHVITSYTMSGVSGSIVAYAPIGKPVANTWVYLLDENLQCVPKKVIGEIYVGGEQLAKGYLNLPEETKERFIPNPFQKDGRLYRTGDLAYEDYSGNIIFVGRKDNQVKIRGYRVELEEIESILMLQDGISQAVVQVKEKKGDKFLVAYFVKEGEVNLGKEKLRTAISKVLPEYMLPAYYVDLDVIPLTPNGKVDKKALPAILEENLIKKVYVAPSTKEELLLVQLWKDLLAVDKIGLLDNFFELGGYSLKAIRLVNLIHKNFNVLISLNEIFSNPTLEQQILLITSSPTSSFDAIVQVPKAEHYAVSAAQRRLWTLIQFEEASKSYNMPGFIELNGDHNIYLFKRAIESVIDRHEILRTIIIMDEKGEVRQKIKKIEALGFEIGYEDFRKEEKGELKARSYIKNDSYKAFDLEQGPFLRASLLQISDDRYIFYYNLHHIISDGWSMEVLERDVMHYYETYKQGKVPELPELSIQYKDYATWQLNHLKKVLYKKDKAYWVGELSGELPLLDFPSYKFRPTIKTYRGYLLSTYIPPEITKKLTDYCQNRGGSLFIGLLAVWKVLCYRYTSQEDVIIGTPVSGRDHLNLEDQIGFYVNTLALRNRVYPENSFDVFFEQVKENTLKAYKHQKYPFDQLVEDLGVKYNMSRSTLFDVMLVLQNTRGNKIGQEAEKPITNQIIDHGYSTSKFDIIINFREEIDGLHISINYNTDVYDRNMIEGLLIHYKQLLNNLLSYPDKSLSEIDYLSEEEKDELLYTFNNTGRGYPEDKTVVELFEEQVRKSPDKIAVIFEDRELTYGDLDKFSNRLAHFLIQRYGVGIEEKVGVKLKRNERMIGCILGILKAGAAYVPIDPEYPEERISYMKNDSGCKITITDELLEIFENEADLSEESPVVKIGPKNLGYVIYTSGSTGKPKGVMIEHRSIVRLVKSSNYYDFTDSDILLSTGAFSFDATTFEFWGPLLNGGRLIVCSQYTLLDSSLLLKEITRHKVNVMWFTSGWLNQLVDTNNDLFKGLSTVIVGGERLSPNHIQKLRKKCPGMKIINGYGPTENTTFSLTYNITDISKDIPIGKPISNSTAYILDGNRRILGKGIIGEIFLGGDGLARGYLNHPELTARKFIPNPFKVGERLYKTGDLGRWLPDGNIEFVGRADDQVKIRGHRIELGEVESALLSLEEVAQVIGDICEINRNKVLVAYVVVAEGKLLNKRQLRKKLRLKLPEYMIPTYFIELEMLPLTSNGKIDRKALKLYDVINESEEFEKVQPDSNYTQNRIKHVLSNILWVDSKSIGLHDNFFDLGVHSLQFIKFQKALLEEFGFEIRMMTLFEYPNVWALSEYLENGKSCSEENEEDDVIDSINDVLDIMND